MALELLTGDKISVGAPFFNETVVFLFLPLLIAVPYGIFLPWKRGGLAVVSRNLWPAGLGALIAMALALAEGTASAKIVIAIGLAAFAAIASIWEVLWRARLGETPIADTWRRLRAMKRGQFGATLGHLGMAVTVIGIAVATAWHAETLIVMKPGDRAHIAGYDIQFKGVGLRQGPNYDEAAGTFELTRGGTLLSTIVASKRKYDAPPTTTTEAGIDPRIGGDVYVVLGNELENGSYSVRLYFQPFVRWIWSGALLMFVGAFISLLDRRLRIGLPAKTRRAQITPSPAPAPAE
jgi:cytochrome c-type biogenesis protein CcmF